MTCFALLEIRQNVRNSFYSANRDFAKNNGRTLQQIIDILCKAAGWAEANRGDVAKSLVAITGVPPDIQTIAANRATFTIGPITEDIIVTQQGVADRFHRLGLIPKAINVRDAVWTPSQT